MLNAEPDTTSDILSENGPHDTSIAPTLPSSHHPSPHRPGRLARSKSAYGASSPKGRPHAPWDARNRTTMRLNGTDRSPPSPSSSTASRRTLPSVANRTDTVPLPYFRALVTSSAVTKARADSRCAGKIIMPFSGHLSECPIVNLIYIFKMKGLPCAY